MTVGKGAKTPQAAPVVEIPTDADERPAWSRVGIVAAAGFLIGIAWPRLAGIQVGPGVPSDARGPSTEATATPTASASATAQVVAAPVASSAPAAQNAQSVVVGPGKISKCSDKKGKKLDECGKLLFDPVALPRLRELAKCPAALGLEGKLTIGFDIDFDKKELHVVKGKKSSLPNSTVQGVLSCAVQELANVALDEVPHEHRRYTVTYDLSFFPPGKQAEPAPAAGDGGEGEGADEDEAKGSTTNETEASGTAMVSWDTALLRKEPKDGDVVARVIRGTRVKILGKQHDWYRVESGGKTGWVYRGAIGL